VEPVQGVTRLNSLPVRLSLDIGTQYALQDELQKAMARYRARGASGVIMEATTGEILAAASLPGVDPMLPREWTSKERRDRLMHGAFELGSVFKLVSVAMALDAGVVRPDTIIDVQNPLVEDGYVIADRHGGNRPLSVKDVFIHSSNVGAGVLALETGTQKQKEFLARLGLLDKLRTEAGPVEPPRAPKRWGRIETITVAYGHGIAVAPLQFAAAAATLLNGGVRVKPTFLRGGAQSANEAGSDEYQQSRTRASSSRVISQKTSAQIRQMMRANVTNKHGTGTRADVKGYRVGGKTGTAELPGRGGYIKKSVISSFIAAFPMEAPRYIVLISLFEPKPTPASSYKIVAARNAAPVAGRVISRIRPLLGVRAKFD